MQRLKLGFLLTSLLVLLTACPSPDVKPPSNVQTLAGTGSIIVSWNNVTGADGYKVYRYQGSSESIVADCNPIPSSPCEDTEVEQGKSYRYSVSTLKGSLESAKSTKTDIVQPGDDTAPTISLSASPASLPAGGGETKLTASVTPKNGKSISKVAFFRGTTLLSTDTSSPYEHSLNVTSNTTFRAVATDSAGKTAEATVTVTVSGGSSSCKAEPKTLTGVVNTPIKGGTRSSGEIAVIVAPLLGASCTTTVSSVTGPQNGTVEKVGDKGFKFTPERKFVGAAEFTYTVSDGTSATVTLNIQEANSAVAGTQYVWYVDNTNPGGMGTATNPFVSYTQGSGSGLTMRSDFGEGDIIYIKASATIYQGTITMKANQKIIGEGEALTVNGLRLAEAGTKPRMTAAGYGFDLGIASQTGEYAQIGTLEIKGLTIQNITGGPTAVSNGSGIRSDNLEGHLIIENVTIVGATGHGMYLDHNNHDVPRQHQITIRNVTITSPGQYGIWVDDPTDLLIEDSVITGIKAGVSYGSNAIDVQDEFGDYGVDKPVVIRNTTVSGQSGTAGIRFIKNNKCRTNVNGNECTNKVKRNSTIVVQNNTISNGIIMQTQTGEEDKLEIYPGTTAQTNHFEYFGPQGDVLLKFSGTPVSCVKNVFEFSNSSAAQVTEARNKIKTTGITCN